MKIISKIYLSLFPCVLWKGVAENASEYCHKGDLLGVKGRLQSRMIEADETKKSVMELVAEKVTYLSSKRQDETDE